MRITELITIFIIFILIPGLGLYSFLSQDNSNKNIPTIEMKQIKKTNRINRNYYKFKSITIDFISNKDIENNKGAIEMSQFTLNNKNKQQSNVYIKDVTDFIKEFETNHKWAYKSAISEIYKLSKYYNKIGLISYPQNFNKNCDENIMINYNNSSILQYDIKDKYFLCINNHIKLRDDTMYIIFKKNGKNNSSSIFLIYPYKKDGKNIKEHIITKAEFKKIKENIKKNINLKYKLGVLYINEKQVYNYKYTIAILYTILFILGLFLLKSSYHYFFILKK